MVEAEKHFKTNKERIEQLEKCKYEDELGHPLENNIAFIELKNDSYSLEELRELADHCYSGRHYTGKDQFHGLWTFLRFLEDGKRECDIPEEEYYGG